MNRKLREDIHKDSIQKILKKLDAQSLYSAEFERIISFSTVLTEESDRGCVLLSAALIENRLAELIKKFIVVDKQNSKELFEGNGPLSTFSSRISMSYSLGLISKKMFSDLNILRKIRNDFAHNPLFISFETGTIADRCRTLEFAGKERANLEPKQCFTRAMLGIDGTIFFCMKSLKNLEKKKDEDLSEREEMFAYLQEVAKGVYDF